MNIIEKGEFKQATKKLKKNQKYDLDSAVKEIAENIYNGRLKSDDLKGIRVHKFKMVKQLTLLAYEYEEEQITLHLLKLGTHENFYRDLKR